MSDRPLIHIAGDFSADRVSVEWRPSSRLRVQEVEAAIESAWNKASSRPGVLLFDGPMCRLESFRAEQERLHLSLSPTSYKPFFGTNLTHAQLADQYGRDVLANPLGASAALETSDGFLMLGRRNASVAYYPNRVHPFAGSVEPPTVEGRPIDLFAEVRRELAEELAFGPRDIDQIRCTGLAEDPTIRQPELMFHIRSTRTQAQVRATLDAAEHAGTWSVRIERQAVENAMVDTDLTPIAVAAILLWGNVRFGADWLAAQIFG